MQRLNARLSPLFLNVIGHMAQKAGLSEEALAQAVTDLSRIFTKERAAMGHSYLNDPVLAFGYLQYFLPVNMSKVQILLNEMPQPKTQGPFSVLDLGSGPGTGALAVLDWWHRRKITGPLTVVAVDRASASHRQAEQLWAHYCSSTGVAEATLHSYECDLEEQSWFEQVKQKAPFDLIILANSLNEIHVESADSIAARTEFVSQLLMRLAPQGTLMILEPALRETSRALHQVRDRLLLEKRCTVYSPCLHEHGCPALGNPSDWCHEERPWDPPASIQEIDEEVGFIKDALKFSYLLLRKDGKTIVERRQEVYRVVSELRELKGEKRAWLCNEQGRQEVGRQDRLASSKNMALDQWHRGAIVQIEKIVRKERDGKVSALGRIEKNVSVQIVRSV